MKHKAINYSPADEKIISQLETMASIYSINYHRPNSVDVSLQFIHKVCAEAWNVNPAEIIGKINHQNQVEKERKTSFLCACFWFSNKSTYEIADYLGCYRSTVFSSKDNMRYRFQYSRKFAEPYLKIFKALFEVCPNRIPNYCKMDLSIIAGVDYDPKLPLELYLTPAKISELPLKSLDWFYNDNTKFTMIAYSVDGKKVAKIVFSRTSDHKLLHALQGHGYRFISYDEYKDNYRLKKVIAEAENSLAKTYQMYSDKTGLPQYEEVSSGGLHLILRERYGKIQLQ